MVKISLTKVIRHFLEHYWCPIFPPYSFPLLISEGLLVCFSCSITFCISTKSRGASKSRTPFFEVGGLGGLGGYSTFPIYMLSVREEIRKTITFFCKIEFKTIPSHTPVIFSQSNVLITRYSANLQIPSQ